MSDKTVVEHAEEMADALEDGTWKTWSHERGYEVKEVLDSLCAMVRDRDEDRGFARRLVEKVRRVQKHIEAGCSHEELMVLCSEILAEDEDR